MKKFVFGLTADGYAVCCENILLFDYLLNSAFPHKGSALFFVFNACSRAHSSSFGKPSSRVFYIFPFSYRP